MGLASHSLKNYLIQYASVKNKVFLNILYIHVCVYVCVYIYIEREIIGCILLGEALGFKRVQGNTTHGALYSTASLRNIP